MVGLRAFGIFVACGLACATAEGQTAADPMGAIDGTVRDVSGGVLSQVIIRAISPAIMGAREATSRDDGFYRIQALSPGEYAVTFTRAGFADAVRRDIRVRPGATTTISIALDLQGLRADVTVAPEGSVADRRVTTIVAAIDAQELADLP